MIIIIETSSFDAIAIYEAIIEQTAKGAKIDIVRSTTIEEAVMAHNNKYAMQA
jgi:hypothetical protein